MKDSMQIIIDGEFLGNRVCINALFQTLHEISSDTLKAFIKQINAVEHLDKAVSINHFSIVNPSRILIYFNNEYIYGLSDLSFANKNSKTEVTSSNLYIQKEPFKIVEHLLDYDLINDEEVTITKKSPKSEIFNKTEGKSEITDTQNNLQNILTTKKQNNKKFRNVDTKNRNDSNNNQEYIQNKITEQEMQSLKKQILSELYEELGFSKKIDLEGFVNRFTDFQNQMSDNGSNVQNRDENYQQLQLFSSQPYYELKNDEQNNILSDDFIKQQNNTKKENEITTDEKKINEFNEENETNNADNIKSVDEAKGVKETEKAEQEKSFSDISEQNQDKETSINKTEASKKDISETIDSVAKNDITEPIQITSFENIIDDCNEPLELQDILKQCDIDDIDTNSEEISVQEIEEMHTPPVSLKKTKHKMNIAEIKEKIRSLNEDILLYGGKYKSENMQQLKELTEQAALEYVKSNEYQEISDLEADFRILADGIRINASSFTDDLFIAGKKIYKWGDTYILTEKVL